MDRRTVLVALTTLAPLASCDWLTEQRYKGTWIDDTGDIWFDIQDEGRVLPHTPALGVGRWRVEGDGIVIEFGRPGLMFVAVLRGRFEGDLLRMRADDVAGSVGHRYRPNDQPLDVLLHKRREGEEMRISGPRGT